MKVTLEVDGDYIFGPNDINSIASEISDSPGHDEIFDDNTDESEHIEVTKLPGVYHSLGISEVTTYIAGYAGKDLSPEQSLNYFIIKPDASGIISYADDYPFTSMSSFEMEMLSNIVAPVVSDKLEFQHGHDES